MNKTENIATSLLLLCDFMYTILFKSGGFIYIIYFLTLVQKACITVNIYKPY